jgi:hypothetical protein
MKMKTTKLISSYLAILAFLSVFGCSGEKKNDEVDGGTAVLSLVNGEHALTLSAAEAVLSAPPWLRADMAFNLVGLEDDLQNELAELMSEIDDPRGLDEVAFCLAHISPSHLSRDDFYPQLIVDNVESLFEIDAAIQYANIVDYGNPFEGGDYYSTVSYAVEIDGVVSQVEMDREYYYWYLVFPVIEDEQPTYVDPDTGDPQDPPVGRFWRDYLFWDSDPGYQPLSSYLEGQTFLWKGKSGWNEEKITDNGAIGLVSQWTKDVMSWGSDYERPLQPVRIYAKHLGRCGEHSDLGTSSGRSAMIPTINISNWGNDHVWNEFWDQRWIQWEPHGPSIDKYGEYYHYGIGVDSDCDLEVDESTAYHNPNGDIDGDGFTPMQGDCNDRSYTSYPGVPDTADGKDNDCNGIVDDGAMTADADGDGQTIAEGDCNDWVATTYLGATEIAADGIDNDCDTIADDGTDTLDADGDSFSIAAGDCDDSAGNIYPGAIERADGKDNDCDGTADNGSSLVDGDGDGFTIDGGDCNDSSNRVYPDALEVTEFRALSMSAWRGDGKVWTVTDKYGAEFTLEVFVTDTNGTPIDGATVMIAGSRLTSDDIYIATWAVTDNSGFASFYLGGNDQGGGKAFFGQVFSSFGNYPEADNTVTLVVDSPVSGDTHTWDVQLDTQLSKLEVTEIVVDASDGWALNISWDLVGYFGGHNFFTDSLSRETAPAMVEVYVVDEQNLALLEGSLPFEAIYSGNTQDGHGEDQVNIPSGQGSWYAAIVPQTQSGGVYANIAASIERDDQAGETYEFFTPVMAGDWAALKIEVN